MERFKTLKDHVYEYIEDEILKGSLLPGERINENAICEQLEISRTPVREALIQLTAEGVLESKARKGFVIKTVQEKEVAELYAVIGVLDGFAAQLACPLLTEKDFDDLDFYADTMDLAINNGNLEMYRKQQTLFHQYYIERCGNNSLIDTLARVKSKLFQTPYVDDPAGEMRKVLHATNEDHHKIVSLFRSGDLNELFRFLAKEHWTPIYAPYDIIV